MKKQLTNIDLFNQSAALIFSELYHNFPVPISLTYQALAKRLCKDDTTDTNDVINIFINTLSWLKRSNYIWLDSESEMEAYGVVLNPKGLEALKITPASDEDSRSIGERLTDTNTPASQQEKTTLINLALSSSLDQN